MVVPLNVYMSLHRGWSRGGGRGGMVALFRKKVFLRPSMDVGSHKAIGCRTPPNSLPACLGKQHCLSQPFQNSYQMMLSVVNERRVARTSSRGLTRKPGCALRLAPVLPAQASAVADTLGDARARGRLVPTASAI